MSRRGRPGRGWGRGSTRGSGREPSEPSNSSSPRLHEGEVGGRAETPSSVRGGDSGGRGRYQPGGARARGRYVFRYLLQPCLASIPGSGIVVPDNNVFTLILVFLYHAVGPEPTASIRVSWMIPSQHPFGEQRLVTVTAYLAAQTLEQSDKRSHFVPTSFLCTCPRARCTTMI